MSLATAGKAVLDERARHVFALHDRRRALRATLSPAYNDFGPAVPGRVADRTIAEIDRLRGEIIAAILALPADPVKDGVVLRVTYDRLHYADCDATDGLPLGMGRRHRKGALRFYERLNLPRPGPGHRGGC